MKPEQHPQETERLRELRRYGILDTDREQAFDEIVELAALLCEAPVSVVNFIDKDRQWFKAEVGLGVRSTPLETSLCGHVILQDEFVEIPDTLEREQRAAARHPVRARPPAARTQRPAAQGDHGALAPGDAGTGFASGAGKRADAAP